MREDEESLERRDPCREVMRLEGNAHERGIRIQYRIQALRHNASPGAHCWPTGPPATGFRAVPGGPGTERWRSPGRRHRRLAGTTESVVL